MHSPMGVYDREKLYEEVWAEPVRTVAAEYGVSDVALAKTCRRLAVPLPGRGYWAKRKAGKAVDRPPLPALTPGKRQATNTHGRGRERRAPAATGGRSKDVPSPEIVVPERLRRPHPLVKETWDLMNGRGPQDEFIYLGDRNCLDVFVSRGSRGRALRIMDALLKAMEAQDHVIDISPSRREVLYGGQARTQLAVTRVKVAEEWIQFGLCEGHRWVKVHRPLDWAAAWGGYSIDRVREPTGRFSLFITNAPDGFRAKWNDGKKQRVEGCLSDFVSYLPVVAQRLKQRREARELRAAKERMRASIRQEAEDHWREEDRRREELLSRLERWRLARDIREYVFHARGSGPLDDDLRWALVYADSVDPARESEARIGRDTC